MNKEIMTVNISIQRIKSPIVNIMWMGLLLLTALIAPLQAQDPPDTLSVILEPINVEATHSSVTMDDAAISVSSFRRSAEDLTSRRASTLDEITFTLPGIWINNRENHALGERLTVRGMGWRSQFGVRGIQVILDDIPLTVADGQTIMNMIDPAMVHSVELLRGPSATFWGNSSGGVLFLRTRPPYDDETPQYRYRGYLGSYNTMKHEAQFSRLMNGVRWNAYGSYYKSDGFRDHSQSELIRGGVSAGFDLSENTRMEARAAYSGMPYAEHPGSLPEQEAEETPRNARQLFADANAGKKFHQWMAAASLYRDFNSGLLTLTSHHSIRDLHNPLPFAYIQVDRHAGGARATYNFNDLPFQLQFGGELKWQRDDRLETNFNENAPGEPGNSIQVEQLEKVGNQALFTQAVIPYGSFSFSAGLRADRMRFSAEDEIESETGSRTFTTLNPGLGITYKLSNARIFGNLSTSFESPTTTEFKNRPTGETGFNQDLNPERTVGLESGIRGYIRDAGLEYDVTLFGMRVRDLIIGFENEEGRSFFRNEGRTRHTGLESQFNLQIHSNLSLKWMYTYLNVQFRDGEFKGNQVPGVTPHRFAATTTLNLGAHTIGFDVEWVGKYYTNSENSVANDPYMLLNGRWMFDGFSFSNWKFQPFLTLNNILNTRYNSSVAINAFGGRYFEPGSNRNFQGGFSIHIQ
ncbi:MAG: TonB-dependent receptor plug domain-containing protein [Balneolaceae bacterium]